MIKKQRFIMPFINRFTHTENIFIIIFLKTSGFQTFLYPDAEHRGILRLIILNDVTHYKIALQDLELANKKLAASEGQLKASEIELKKQLEKSEKQRKANVIVMKDLSKTTRELMNEINQRKKVEIKLKESEARFRELIQTTSEGFWLLDINKKRLM